MFNKRVNKPLIIFTTVAAIFVISFLINVRNKKLERAQTTQNQAQVETKYSIYNFAEIGLSFTAPENLEVKGGFIDDQNFTLYIENGLSGDDYYQLYGFYRISDDKIDKEGLKSGLNPDTVSEKTVSGLAAIEGQLVGERNRYITYIILPEGLLTLATSQPTEKNKILSDTIINTFKFESK